MKIETYSGCTADAIIIDGKPLLDFTPPETIILIDTLLVKLKEKISTGECQISDIISLFQYDEYETGPICDQCGDSVSSTIYNL